MVSSSRSTSCRFAEQTGLIVPIGAWVVQEACRVASLWPTMPDGTALSIAVNASVRELAESDYAERVQHALATVGWLRRS